MTHVTAAATEAAGANWSGNHAYQAAELRRPTTLEELQEVVAASPRVRALGSRHSFNDLADTEGVLVSLDRLAGDVVVDEQARLATVPAGLTYAQVAASLHGQGWALANLASLPHISVAGAVATGTHGSGDGLRCLSAAVRRVETVTPSGELVTVTPEDGHFAGSVVALGALGVVTSLDLEVEPTYDIAQHVFLGVPWDAVAAELDDVRSTTYSVSVFTDWRGEAVSQVWTKSRDAAVTPPGWQPADSQVHMLNDAEVEATTSQLGVPGPWHERLPHFRASHTPSRGQELQSEYFVPRDRVTEAIEALRWLGDALAEVLLVSEIRTVAADDLWLSGACGRDTAGLHFTWELDEERVRRVLGSVEAALLPLGARPHWGKVFVTSPDDLASAYPRFEDFRRLRARTDPEGKLDNRYLARVFGPLG